MTAKQYYYRDHFGRTGWWWSRTGFGGILILLVRCTFVDKAIITFEDNFCSAAELKEFSLIDEGKKDVAAAKCFHAKNWRNSASSARLPRNNARQIFWETPYPKPRFKYACWFYWQSHECKKPPGKCDSVHVCGQPRFKIAPRTKLHHQTIRKHLVSSEENRFSTVKNFRIFEIVVFEMVFFLTKNLRLWISELLDCDQDAEFFEWNSAGFQASYGYACCYQSWLRGFSLRPMCRK